MVCFQALHLQQETAKLDDLNKMDEQEASMNIEQKSAELESVGVGVERAEVKRLFSWRRLLVRLGAVIVALALIAFFAANMLLQSEGTRARIIAGLESRTGMIFRFDEIRWSPLDGVSIYGLKVDQRVEAKEMMPNNTPPPFFRATKVRIDVFWTDLLAGRRVVKTFEVIEPTVFLIRGENGRLQIPVSSSGVASESEVKIPVTERPVVQPSVAPVEATDKVVEGSSSEASPVVTKVVDEAPPLVTAPRLLVTGASFILYDVSQRQAIFQMDDVGVDLPGVMAGVEQKDGNVFIGRGVTKLVPGVDFRDENWSVAWENGSIRSGQKNFALWGGEVLAQFLWSPRQWGAPVVAVFGLKGTDLGQAVEPTPGDVSLDHASISGQVRVEALLSRSNAAVASGALMIDQISLRGGDALKRFALATDAPLGNVEREEGEEGSPPEVLVGMPHIEGRFLWRPTASSAQQVDFQGAGAGANLTGQVVIGQGGRIAAKIGIILTGPAKNQLAKLEERLPRALHFGFKTVAIKPVTEVPTAETTIEQVVERAGDVETALGREFDVSGTLKEPRIAVWDRGELLTLGSLVRRISSNLIELEPEPSEGIGELLPMK